jgi:hypothetical protein
MNAPIPVLQLQCHSADGSQGSLPAHGTTRAIAVSGSLESTGRLDLSYVLCGDLARLQLPGAAGTATRSGVRRDELWRHTCMELFARGDDAPGYLEFNFSPDGDWAAYGFEDYRTGRRDLDARDGAAWCEHHDEQLHLHFSVSVPSMAATAGVTTWRLGLAAIVADPSGALSYWALRHPRPQPDFHDPAGFSYVLRAPTD